MLNVLIADDHDLVRRGLRDLLTDEFEELHIGEASDGAQIRQRLVERKWDLVLLDILMPDQNVLEMLAEIRQRDLELPVLILTAVNEAEYAVRVIKAGANGYITKQHASDELIVAIHKVLAGETYLSSAAAKALATDLRHAAVQAPHEALTKRELEVFCMVAQGKAVKEIAHSLSLSAKTVGTHIQRIKNKTGLDNYVDFARYALRHKLVD
jgi:two-component system invasion response regulator UvrY